MKANSFDITHENNQTYPLPDHLPAAELLIRNALASSPVFANKLKRSNAILTLRIEQVFQEESKELPRIARTSAFDRPLSNVILTDEQWLHFEKTTAPVIPPLCFPSPTPTPNEIKRLYSIQLTDIELEQGEVLSLYWE